MSTVEEICRLCRGFRPQSDLISDLSEIEQGTKSSLGDYVNFYCRVQLKTEDTYSKKVCRFCRLYLETFIAFCDNLSKAEANNHSLNSLLKKEDPDGIQSELMEPKQEKSANISKNRRKLGKKTSVENVVDVFKKYLEKNLFELDDFSHVTVPKESVLPNGEVSKAFLDQYDITTWADFKYKCSSCKKSFDLVYDILKHFEETSCKFKICCSLADCERVFASLSAFVNHVSKTHQNSMLFYTCFVCNKVMYNIASLINHFFVNHRSVPNFYPCIECGTYCNNLAALKVHFMTHDTQEVSDSSDEEVELKSEAETRKKARNQTIGAVKRVAQVVEEQERKRNRREVFECDKCNHILLTRQGLSYHKSNVCVAQESTCEFCKANFPTVQKCYVHGSICRFKSQEVKKRL